MANAVICLPLGASGAQQSEGGRRHHDDRNDGRSLSQIVRFKAYDLLQATNRQVNGQGAALERLRGTTISTNIVTGGEEQFDVFGLIDRAKDRARNPRRTDAGSRNQARGLGFQCHTGERGVDPAPRLFPPTKTVRAAYLRVGKKALRRSERLENFPRLFAEKVRLKLDAPRVQAARSQNRSARYEAQPYA